MEFKTMSNKEFLSSRKKYFLLALALFLSALFFGAVKFSGGSYETEQFMNTTTEQFISQEIPMSYSSLSFYLFTNNIKVNFLALFGGILLIFPIGIVLYNGYAIGWLISSLISSERIGYATLLLLIPHGIIEIPMFMISVGLGMSLSASLLISVFKGGWSRIADEFLNIFSVFFKIIIPFTLIAALIESYIILF